MVSLTPLVIERATFASLVEVQFFLILSGAFIIVSAIYRDKSDRELRDARDAAERANQSKSAFLANMSHEIRTPMNGVIGMAEILSRTKLQPKQSGMLRTIRNSSHSLLRIIDDILDLSKIEAGKLHLESAPVDVRDLLENVLDALRPIANSANVRMSLSLDPSLPAFIMADAVRSRQVLMNLLSNALKFSSNPEGHPTLKPNISAMNRISLI